ncbi:MAG: DUF4835 family protein [Methanococcaceae archaeon]
MKSLIAVFFLLPLCLFSQELDARVTVNLDKIPANGKDLLSGFGQAIQDYLNTTKFTTDAWEGDKIKCSFNVFFDNANDETHYSAQVSITSLRPVYHSSTSSLMLNVLDNTWSFVYQRGQSINFNQSNFDPLTSFLDYYAYVIIGLDADSFNSLGGSSLFSQALNICLLGANSQNSKGWEKNSSSYSRRGLMDDLLSEKYRIFRENYFDYHYNGVDMLATKKEVGQANIVKLIKNLEILKTKQEIRGVLLKTFFDAKSGEIISSLSDFPDKSIFTSLKKVDPAHLSKYEEAMK